MGMLLDTNLSFTEPRDGRMQFRPYGFKERERGTRR